MKNEEWKAIEGYEGLYEASSLGRVRSMDRESPGKNGSIRKVKGRILKPQAKDGRKTLYVKLCKKQKIESIYVHILIAKTFIGERPEGYAVCHIDGDNQNNSIDNLTYDTYRQNSIDVYRQNKKSNLGKLFPSDVKEIRSLYKNKIYTRIELAGIYGVTEANIYCIVTYKTFSYINDDGEIIPSATKINYKK